MNDKISGNGGLGIQTQTPCMLMTEKHVYEWGKIQGVIECMSIFLKSFVLIYTLETYEGTDINFIAFKLFQK